MAKDWKTCEGLIRLSAPTGKERVRDFQPPWRTVYVYRCPACGQERRVRASSYLGKNPIPSSGAIRCGAYVTLRTS